MEDPFPLQDQDEVPSSSDCDPVLKAWQRGEILSRDAVSFPLAIRLLFSYKMSAMRGNGGGEGRERGKGNQVSIVIRRDLTVSLFQHSSG